MNDAINNLTNKLQPVFRKYPDIVFCYLFGSMADGSNWSSSDVDLAVFMQDPKTFSFSKKLQIHGECCRALARNDVDFVILNQTKNLILLEEIVRNGTIILNRDQNILDNFEVKIIHQAIDFRDHRKRMMGI